MSYNNESQIIIPQQSNQLISILIQFQLVLNHLSPILIIFGTLGFIGNCLTFLHPTIRRNTCSIYSLCSTVVDELDLLANLLLDYLATYGYTFQLPTVSALCKFVMFKRIFLPQLSIGFLILALIDRFACSCQLTSKWRKMNQLKVVPWMSGLALLYSFSIAVQALFFYDITPPPIVICMITQVVLSSILYIVMSTVGQILFLSLFTVLIFRNVKRSRRRVNLRIPSRLNRQFIRMTVVQVIVTALLSIQFITVYTFFIVTTRNMNTLNTEQFTIIFFVFSLSYQIFYINNVKFFYLSTLSSSLYRKTFKTAIMQYLPRTRFLQWFDRNRRVGVAVICTHATRNY